MKTLLNCLKKLKDLAIIHRDIKFNNFLYNMKSKKGILIDFGSIKIVIIYNIFIINFIDFYFNSKILKNQKKINL